MDVISIETPRKNRMLIFSLTFPSQQSDNVSSFVFLD